MYKKNQIDIINILFIIILVATVYLITSSLVSVNNQIVVPTGDPFTYANGWMNVIQNTRDAGYIKGLLLSTNSWYLMQSILYSVLSPFLIFDPVSLAKVNFLIYLVTCLIIYTSLRNLSFGNAKALTVTLVYMIMPWHYLTTDAISLYTLQLDTIYVNLLFGYCFLAISAISTGKIKSLILLGIISGFAMWSRSNSPIIIILIFASVLFGIFFTKKLSSIELAKRITISGAIFILMTITYYYKFLPIVLNYYKPLNEISKTNTVDFVFILEKLLIIPGVFIAGTWNEPYLIKFISLLSHFFVILAVFFIIKYDNSINKIKYIKIFFYSGICIYIFVISLFLSLFQTKDTFFYQPYAPCLIGLLLIMSGYICASKVDNYKLFNKHFYLVVFILLSIYTFSFVKYSIRPFNKFIDQASKVSYLSNNIENILGSGRIAFLWYGVYNTPIINYYRVINGNKVINFNNDNNKISFYNNIYWNDLWIPASNYNLLNIKNGIDLVFNEADFIVLPKDKICYQTDDPYPLYINNSFVFEAFENYKSNFKVVMVLNESEICKLLLMSRIK